MVVNCCSAHCLIKIDHFYDCLGYALRALGCFFYYNLRDFVHSVYTLKRHGGVDPKDLCLVAVPSYLMFDVAKAMVVVSCAQDCRLLALEPSLFLVRRILC